MGLDNGIVVKRTDKLDKIRFFANRKTSYPNCYEIAYWRKCWNVRAEIFIAIAPKGNNNDYSLLLDKKDILNIIVALWKMNRFNWDEGYSIWSWRKIRKWNHKYIFNLIILYFYMLKYSDILVQFYDSY